MLKVLDLFSGVGGFINYPIDLDGYMVEDPQCINSVFYDWLCEMCDPVRTEDEIRSMFEDAYGITNDILRQARPLHRYEDYRIRACNATYMGEGANRRIFDDSDKERENCVMSMVYHLLGMQGAEKNTRKRQLMDKIFEHMEIWYYTSLNMSVQQTERKLQNEASTRHALTCNSPNAKPAPLHALQCVAEPVPKQEKTITTSKGSSHLRTRGARKKRLFGNEQAENRWANVFVEYLKFHHSANTEIDTSGENFITRALLSFLREWQRHGIVDKNSVCGPACARFLQEACNLTFGVVLRAYEDRLTRILNGKAKRPSTIDDVRDYVRQKIHD